MSNLIRNRNKDLQKRTIKEKKGRFHFNLTVMSNKIIVCCARKCL